MIIESLKELQSQLIKQSRIVDAMRVEKLFKTAVSRNQFSDFYMLSALQPFLEEGKVDDVGNIIIYRDKLLTKIVEYYLTETKKALIGEADIFSARSWPSNKSARQKLNDAGIEKGVTRSQIRNFTPFQFQVYFKYMEWAHAYGGEPWAYIARLYGELKRVWEKIVNTLETNPHKYVRWSLEGKIKGIRNELVQIIDFIHNAEHNSGSLFTKFPQGETQWLREALTEKAIPSSIQAMKKWVSPNVWQVYESSPLQKADVSEEEIYTEKLHVEIEKFIKGRVDKVKKEYNKEFRNLAQFLHEDAIKRPEYNRRLQELQERYQKDLAEAENLKAGYTTSSLIDTFMYLYPNQEAKAGLLSALAFMFVDEGNKDGLIQLVNNSEFVAYVLNPDFLEKVGGRSKEFKDLALKSVFDQLTQGYFPYLSSGIKQIGAKYFGEIKKYVKDQHSIDSLMQKLIDEDYKVSKPGEQLRFELPTPPVSVKAPTKLEPTPEEVKMFMEGKTNFSTLMKAVKMFWERMNAARVDLNLAEAKKILEVAAQEMKNEQENNKMTQESFKQSAVNRLRNRYIKLISG